MAARTPTFIPTHFKIFKLGGPFSCSCKFTPIICLLGCLLFNRWFIRGEVLGSRFRHKILSCGNLDEGGGGWEGQSTTSHSVFQNFPGLSRFRPVSGFIRIPNFRISGFPDLSGHCPLLNSLASGFSRIFPDLSGFGPFLNFWIFPDLSGFFRIRTSDNPCPWATPAAVPGPRRCRRCRFGPSVHHFPPSF